MIIKWWHTWLDMPKFSREWHIQDMVDELEELRTAHGFFKRWSEKADVLYTYTRAQWVGYNDIARPLSYIEYAYATVYMIPKYTLRYLFFLHAGKTLKLSIPIKAVRNPDKTQKLASIAQQYHIDEKIFVQQCIKQRKSWLLLP
jgi:hypothetical protein